MTVHRYQGARTGGVYIAVLASALIVALMGMSALVGQRMQNRLVVAQYDIRQAQLNANAAVEIGLLAMSQDTNWRTTYSNGNWFVKRNLIDGTCTLNATDPVDGNLTNSADDPLVLTGIGYSGQAEQRVRLTVDPRKDPLSCLRSAVAVGDQLALNGDTLRTAGLISANQTSASSSQVYGKVEATAISGSTYNGTTAQIASDKRPTMPDWTSVFNYYRTNGTKINISDLPSQTPNLGRNFGMENGVTDWTGTAPGMPICELETRTSPVHGGSASIRVKNRSAWYAGAAQSIEGFVKPNQQYTIDIWVNLQSGSFESFYISLFTKGTSSSVQFVTGPDTLTIAGVWRQISATLTAPSWSGNLEYAFIKIAGANSSNDRDFVIDDFTIRETTSGRFIYRQVLSPNNNPFGTGVTNPEGIYWIDCAGSRLIIERSRILGTLLVVNPGANSCVGNGPISWSPAVAGYPALLVDADSSENADFSLNATNRNLSEKENGVNYNPAGAPHEEFGQDVDANDSYRSTIRGMIVVRDDLAYQNRTLIRGQVLVGDDVNNPSGELEIEYLPDSLLNPPPGFTAPYWHSRRPASFQKIVLP